MTFVSIIGIFFNFIEFIMALKYIDHYTGANGTEGYSIVEYYRDQRKQFLEFLAQINEDYRLNIIEIYITDLSQELKSNAPDVFESYQNGDLFTPNKFFGMERDDKIEMASFIEFLKKLKVSYKELELIKAGEIKWIGDYQKFIELYQLLFQYNFIECDLQRFRKFFALTDNLNLKINIYETSILFHELTEKRYITKSTLESMLQNGSIIATDGRFNKQTVINKKIFSDNKSKNKLGKSLNIVGLDFKEAMAKFGIFS